MTREGSLFKPFEATKLICVTKPIDAPGGRSRPADLDPQSIGPA